MPIDLKMKPWHMTASGTLESRDLCLVYPLSGSRLGRFHDTRLLLLKTRSGVVIYCFLVCFIDMKFENKSTTFNCHSFPNCDYCTTLLCWNAPAWNTDLAPKSPPKQPPQTSRVHKIKPRLCAVAHACVVEPWEWFTQNSTTTVEHNRRNETVRRVQNSIAIIVNWRRKVMEWSVTSHTGNNNNNNINCEYLTVLQPVGCHPRNAIIKMEIHKFFNYQ